MRMRAFMKRNVKEILRDPLTIIFGLGFPLVLLFLMSAIQKKIPVEMFTPERLTPGISVFGMSFISLFAAMLIARDRSGALLQRLYTTPMTPFDYICGYTLPMLPLAFLQTVICYLAGFTVGLEFSPNVIYSMLSSIIVAPLFISIGVICGTLLSVNQVGGICGALLTNITAWLSGIWFDLDLVGGIFEKIAHALPFVHAVELQKLLLDSSADIDCVFSHTLTVIGYSLPLFVLASFVFAYKMKK